MMFIACIILGCPVSPSVEKLGLKNLPRFESFHVDDIACEGEHHNENGNKVRDADQGDDGFRRDHFNVRLERVGGELVIKSVAVDHFRIQTVSLDRRI